MIRWLLAWLLAVIPAPLLADELRPVSIYFKQVGQAEWSLGWRQPVVPGATADTVVPILPDTCHMAEKPVYDVTPIAVGGRARVMCEGTLDTRALGWDFATPGEAILRVAPLGRSMQVHRLTPEKPMAVIQPRASAAQVWRSYFRIGVEHILEGWDHLLFVIALVLLVGRGWAVVKAATAFTVAHSLTLAAVTLGVAGLPQRPVEVLIALSIVFLAVEVARGTKDTLTRRLPWLVAFLFGLFHGFGFAGALREIGLPEGEVPAALISFNLGVEAGQLLVIGLALMVLAAIRRARPAAETPALRFASYAIGITGAYWLVDRLVG
ncbi:HupE/UreJ family protein [Erythrobacter sp. SD-21]|uniref:HupE/UreJ family protein n=1 Tax=Erythrobacter sp. SD-21 TaxID=161528 RepID=UPI000153F3CF|nr:HupE/UreJ family protein [Erythrobacter sp. SD-21]EDL48354.1 hypothetical protein ED21_22598 [Erythrobacter sp. SD-21]